MRHPGWTLAVCGILVAITGAGAMGADGTRSATYAGAGWASTLDRELPQGVHVANCDDADLLDSGVNGIGGVLFCAVPQGDTIRVQVTDDYLRSVQVVATCYRADTLNHWSFASFYDRGTLRLPAWCSGHPDDPGGTTRIGVFPVAPPTGTGATTGTVTLR